MQQPLVSLYLPSYNPLDPSPQERLIVLPLPTQDSSLPEILLTLISTYLLHSIVALTHAISPSHTSSQPICGILCSSGSQTPTLLTWLPYIKNLPTKHLDSILTRAYTTLTKAWSSSNAYPTSIFQLRVYGLFCLAHTSPSVLEPTAFWEQVIKFTMNYVAANVIDKDPGRGRDDGGSAGPRQDGEVTNVVLHSFDELVGRTQERQGFMKGRGFVKFCEYWMSMARKVGVIHSSDRYCTDFDTCTRLAMWMLWSELLRLEIQHRNLLDYVLSLQKEPQHWNFSRSNHPRLIPFLMRGSLLFSRSS